MDNHLVIPGLRAMARHSWVNLVVGKVVPAILFLAFFGWFGTMVAIVAALAWSLVVVVVQRWRGQRIAGLVLISIIGNVAKSIVALATGSVFVYFLQPTISTTLVGLAFLVSVPLGTPLAERLVRDFCPIDDRTVAHPDLNRFFERVSVLWALTSMLNAAITVYLLLTQSVVSFVVLKSFLGPATTSLTLAIGIWWFRQDMARAGIRVVIARDKRVGSGRPVQASSG